MRMRRTLNMTDTPASQTETEQDDQLEPILESENPATGETPSETQDDQHLEIVVPEELTEKFKNLWQTVNRPREMRMPRWQRRMHSPQMQTPDPTVPRATYREKIKTLRQQIGW